MNTREPLSETGTVRLVAGPGLNTETVVRAPPDEEHKSKRYEGITTYAGELDEDADVLDVQTREKNREFERRLQGLVERRHRCERHIEVEVKQRVVADEEVRATFSRALQAVDTSFLEQLGVHNADFEKRLSFMGDERMVKWNASFRHFVDVTVPDVVDKQSGAVTRHLHKSRETFEIDNTKLLKREEKINLRFAAHEKEVDQSFTQEAKTREERQTLMYEAIDETDRLADRGDEVLQSEITGRLIELKQAVDAEQEERSRRDAEILTSLTKSIDRLQDAILKNFGASNEEGVQ